MSRGQRNILPGWRHGAILLAAALAVIATPIFTLAADADSSRVLGVWIDEPKKVAVEFYPCEEQFCAKIVWLARPYRKDGKIKRDDRNPDPALWVRPYCGLEMIWGLEGKSDRAWVRGRLYYPKTGDTYKLGIKLIDGNRLTMRAYRIVKLFGYSETWSRPDPDRTISCPLQP